MKYICATDLRDISLLKSHPLGYKRVYLPLCKVADTPFYIQGDEVVLTSAEQGIICSVSAHLLIQFVID